MKKRTAKKTSPLVAVVMGSRSDWDTLSEASKMLDQFDVEHICQVVSAHRTPKHMAEFAEAAAKKGIKVVIAGAGGAAHLPGMIAAQTHLPVLGVPVESKVLKGLDSLLSIVQMPAGVPVGTLAIGKSGAANAALLAISILSLDSKTIQQKLIRFRKDQTDRVLKDRNPKKRVK